jgi:hypothetical protein
MPGDVQPTPSSVLCTSHTGDEVELSLDCSTFGFAPMTIVHFTKSRLNGRVALVRGTNGGMLWFALFHSVEEALSPGALTAVVQTTSCRGKEELIRQYGWMVHDGAAPPTVTAANC